MTFELQIESPIGQVDWAVGIVIAKVLLADNAGLFEQEVAVTLNNTY
jgi:hypothetical protein